MPISAIERLANVLVRYATEVNDPALRLQYTRRARHYLRVLNALGATGEREALWGSYLKKRATMTESERWRTFFVTRSAARYANAQKLEPSSYHELAARQLGSDRRCPRRRGATPVEVSSGARVGRGSANGHHGGGPTPASTAPVASAARRRPPRRRRTSGDAARRAIAG